MRPCLGTYVRSSTVVVMLAITLSACQISNPGAPTVAAPVNHCTTSADCTDSVCDPTRHQCVATNVADVFFRATPTMGISATAFPTVTPVLNPHSGDVVDLTLHAPHTVYGEVLAPNTVTGTMGEGGMATGEPIVATVVFTPTDPIYGGPVEVTASSTPAAPINNDAAGYSYSTLLSDGSYNVLVSPTSALANTIPPWYQQAFAVGASAPVQRYDLRYPSDYVLWAGVVADPTGVPLQGLTVQCVDPANGNLQVSTVVTTDAAGAFSLHIAPGAPSAWSLRVTSATSANAQLTVDIPRAVLDSSGYPAQALHVSMPFSTSWLPPPGVGTVDSTAMCTGCVAVQATIEAPGSDNRPVPVRGAGVVLMATIPTPGMDPTVHAWYEAQATTASDGSLTTSLVPGNYAVVITPQDDSIGNAIERNFVVRTDVRQQAGQVFTLASALAVSGRVLTPTGAPVVGARVRAVPFQDAYPTSACLTDPDMAVLAPLADEVDDTTETDGDYNLPLDPGLYRFAVEAPDSLGFPVTLSNPVCVASGVRAFDIVLDAPVAVRGTLHDSSGVPVPGATVESLIRVRDPGAVGVVLVVGRTVTATDGSFSALLPDDTSTTP